MARYLMQVSYTIEGAKGLLREGGKSFAGSATVQKLVESMGGTGTSISHWEATTPT